MGGVWGTAGIDVFVDCYTQVTVPEVDTANCHPLCFPLCPCRTKFEPGTWLLKQKTSFLAFFEVKCGQFFNNAM